MVTKWTNCWKLRKCVCKTIKNMGRKSSWLGCKKIPFLKKIFFLMFIFERERDRTWVGEGQRERWRHRIWSRSQALSCQHRAQCGARTYKLRDYDLNWSQTLNRLSHQATLPLLFSWGTYHSPSSRRDIYFTLHQVRSCLWAGSISYLTSLLSKAPAWPFHTVCKDLLNVLD